VGEQGGLLTEDLPELKTILGPQPPVAPAAPYEAALRFQGLVRRFLRQFCGAGQCLVMFIDDLQWADPASINMLTALAGGEGLEGLLLILGYRSNELGIGHPAQRALAAWRAADVADQVIRLGPLAFEDIRDLIADSLQVSWERAARR
jgi:predicted ATPase